MVQRVLPVVVSHRATSGILEMGSSAEGYSLCFGASSDRVSVLSESELLSSNVESLGLESKRVSCAPVKNSPANEGDRGV